MPTRPIRTLLLEEYHNLVFNGHAGVLCTYHRLVANFFWYGLRANVKNMLLTTLCANSPSPPPRLRRCYSNLFQFRTLFRKILISLDFVIGLPSSQGKIIIVVAVDRLSKYGHFIPLSTGFTSQIVANIFLKENSSPPWISSKYCFKLGSCISHFLLG